MTAEKILIDALEEYRKNHKLSISENTWIDMVIHDTKEGYQLDPLRLFCLMCVRPYVTEEPERLIVDCVESEIKKRGDFWEIVWEIVDGNLEDWGLESEEPDENSMA